MSRRRGFSSSEEEEEASRPPRQHKGAQFATRCDLHHQHPRVFLPKNQFHCKSICDLTFSQCCRTGQLSPLQDDTYSDPTQYVAGSN